MALPERGQLAWPEALEPDHTFTLSNGLVVHYKYNALNPLVHVSVALKDAEAARLAWGVRQQRFAAEVWPEMEFLPSITDLYVRSEFRSQGIGTAMIHEMEKKLGIKKGKYDRELKDTGLDFLLGYKDDGDGE